MGIFLGAGRESRALTPWAGEPPIIVNPAGGPGRMGSIAELTVPTVYQCVSLLANTIATFPLERFQRAGELPKRIPDGPFLTSPAAGMTQSEWVRMVVVSMCLRGNAYGRIVGRDADLRPNHIELLDPDAVTVRVDPSSGVTYTLNRTQQKLPAYEAWHLRGLTFPGQVVGISPIDMMAQVLNIDVSSRQFAADFFNGGGIPKAVLKTDQAVNQEQARTIKDRLLAGTRSREPIVLGQGLDYVAISVKPDESQFIQTQQANIGTIAGFWHVPPEMVGGSRGSAMTYSSTETQGLELLIYGVGPYLKPIEDAVSLLLPDGEFVKFNTSSLLRMDAKTQAEVDNMQLAGKTRVGSEFRLRDGLPPFTPEQQVEADMVPLTITPMGGAKALPALKQPPGLEAPVPAAEVQQNSAPHIHFHQGDTHVDMPPVEVRFEQPITVLPAAPAEVRQDIHVAAAAPAEVRQQINVAAAEVRLEQPITVQPAAPAEVRMVSVGAEARTRRVERDSAGDIVRIVEE